MLYKDKNKKMYVNFTIVTTIDSQHNRLTWILPDTILILTRPPIVGYFVGKTSGASVRTFCIMSGRSRSGVYGECLNGSRDVFQMIRHCYLIRREIPGNYAGRSYPKPARVRNRGRDFGG